MITLYNYCHGNVLEHNRSQELENNILPLAPYGAQPSVMSIDFYPDWLVSIVYEYVMDNCINVVTTILVVYIKYQIAH